MIIQLKRTFIYLIATGLGSGYSPIAPGTAGSLLALIIFWLVPLNHFVWLLVIIFLFILGVWSGNQVEKEHGKDPGLVVCDEMTGQWISLLFIPRHLLIYFAAFIIFRLLDIIKPFPADKSQNIPGGMGIMLDDLIAAIYTNVLLQLYLYFFY